MGNIFDVFTDIVKLEKPITETLYQASFCSIPLADIRFFDGIFYYSILQYISASLTIILLFQVIWIENLA